MLKLLVPLITLGLFVWLAVYAWKTHPPVYPVTVTLGEFKVQKVAEAEQHDTGILYRAKSKVVYVWRDAKAAAIADALSLTPETIENTVDVRSIP